MSERTYFGCMDFRNAKYQGLIRENSLEGIGIVLDNDYMLSLSSWRNQIPNGPTLTIFPNRDYFYGRFKNKQLHGICCYQVSTGQAYYFNFIEGSSESIAFVENSSILEVENRGQSQKVKSYIKDPKDSEKWQIISNILRADVTEEYQDYRSFVQSNFLKEFKEVIELSESANLTFVGFKNSVSLGVKFDQNNQVRLIGNFQQFPRNIEFGKRFTSTSTTDIKVQQGKFTAPEQVYVYRNDSRSPEALKYTENYFKKGTNFRNEFLRFNTFVEVSKYFRDIKILVQDLKVFEFGQNILEKPSNQLAKEENEGTPNKIYNLQEVKKDIYNRANKKGKMTNRSPTKYSIDQSPRKNSSERYQYLKQIKQPQAPKIFERSKDKYMYIKQLRDTTLNQNPPKQSEFILRYKPVAPEVSQFDRNIHAYYENAAINQKILEQLERQKLMNIKMEELRRQEALRRAYADKYHVSPVSMLYQPASNTNRSKSPLRRFDYADEQKKKNELEQQKYQNYLKYKNRSKPEDKKADNKPQLSGRTPQKNIKYERKVLGPNNLASQSDAIMPERINLPGRYKKTYKYLQ